jgi:4,5-dihydroxyphthalate decarboxylase
VHQRVKEITGDPLPYGIAPNRIVLDELIRHSLAQRIITRPVSVEALFPPETRALVG